MSFIHGLIVWVSFALGNAPFIIMFKDGIAPKKILKIEMKRDYHNG